jgi:hypothetical protein
MDVYSEGLFEETTILPDQVGLVPKELAEAITIFPDSSLARDFAGV